MTDCFPVQISLRVLRVTLFRMQLISRPFFRPTPSCPGANHQADRPGNGCEGGHQFQRGDRRQGRELYQRLRQGETRHSSRMVLKPETCPKCLDTEPEHRETHNVNLENGGRSADLNISGFE